MIRIAAARTILIFLAAGGLTGCAGGDRQITGDALSRAVGPMFARLYVLDQQDQGVRGSDRIPDGIAQCARGIPSTGALQPSKPTPGTSAPASSATKYFGAGDDWLCVVNFPHPDGHIEPIAYDLSVAATGCFVASGPGTIVGPQTFISQSGRTLTNPLFEFDGCLDLG